MANLPEVNSYDPYVYEIAVSDPVVGGPDGAANKPLKNLANRTKWLYNQVVTQANATSDIITALFSVGGRLSALEATGNQSIGENFSTGFVELAGATIALSATHAGKLIMITTSTSGSSTIVLPAIGSVPARSRFRIVIKSTIKAFVGLVISNGSDVISNYPSTGIKSLYNGDTVEINRNGSVWEVSLLSKRREVGMPGEIGMFATAYVPDGYLLANGAQVSRVTYADLFAYMGTQWGSGNGSDTFHLPDFRGYFLRSLDGNRGIDSFPGRGFGSVQTDAAGYLEHTHLMNHNLYASTVEPGTSSYVHAAGSMYSPLGYEIANPSTSASKETRPKNMAVYFGIKY